MKLARFLLVSLVFVLVAAICVSLILGSGKGNEVKRTPGPVTLTADDITATFGADRFHQQLTAIATEQATASVPAP